MKVDEEKGTFILIPRLYGREPIIEVGVYLGDSYGFMNYGGRTNRKSPLKRMDKVLIVTESFMKQVLGESEYTNFIKDFIKFEDELESPKGEE